MEQTLVDIIHSIKPGLNITEAEVNEDREESFRSEAAYQAFLDKNISGIQIELATNEMEVFLEQLDEALNDDYTIYISDHSYDEGPSVVKILKTSDKYDALMFEGTNGINYDKTVEDIIDFLKQLETDRPFQLYSVGFDSMLGVFEEEVEDVEKLAEALYEFCPDVVDQGTETVEALAAEIENSNSFYFWWD